MLDQSIQEIFENTPILEVCSNCHRDYWYRLSSLKVIKDGFLGLFGNRVTVSICSHCGHKNPVIQVVARALHASKEARRLSR